MIQAYTSINKQSADSYQSGDTFSLYIDALPSLWHRQNVYMKKNQMHKLRRNQDSKQEPN